MAGRRDVKAGRAFVELYTCDDKFRRGLDRAARRMRMFGQQMSALGGQMLRMSVIAAAPLALATKIFMGFSDQMMAVKAVTGATGKAFDKLNEQAKELGRTTSFTAGQVAGGMLNLARAGFAVDEIAAAIPGVLDLARATGTDLALSAEIASGVLRAFEMDVREMPRVVDALAAAANNSATTLTDLGEAFSYASVIANKAGESVESTAISLGLLANINIKGSTAATAFNAAVLQLAKPDVQKRLAAIGIETTRIVDGMKDFRPVGSILADFAKHLNTLGTSERLEFAELLFGKRGLRAIPSAKMDIDKLVDAVNNAGGTAAKTAKIMDSGLGGVFRRLMSAAEGVAIAIGEALTGSLSDFGEDITEIAASITAFINTNRQWVVVIAEVAAGLLVVGAACKVVAAAIFLGPMGVALAAFGAAVVYITMHTSKATKEMHAMADAARKAAAAATAGNQQRDAMRAQLAELGKLAKSQELSSEQMDRAETIIGVLNGAYGDLGLSVDRASGSIKGFSDAQKEANRLMREAAELDIRRQISALQKQQQALITASTELTGAETLKLYSGVGAVEGLLSGEPYLNKVAARQEGLREQALEIGKETEALFLKLRALRTGEGAGAPIGAPGSRVSATSVDAEFVPGAVDPELRAAADANHAIFHRQEVIKAGMIKDRYAREVALIDERYRHEIFTAQRAGKDITRLEELHQLELTAAKQRQLDDLALRADQTSEEEAETRKNVELEIAELEIETTKKGHAKRLALFRLELVERMKELKKAGLSETLRKKLKSLLTAQFEASATATTAMGTFDPFQAMRMAGPAMTKLEKSNEEIAKNTKKIAEKKGVLQHT